MVFVSKFLNLHKLEYSAYKKTRYLSQPTVQKYQSNATVSMVRSKVPSNSSTINQSIRFGIRKYQKKKCLLSLFLFHFVCYKNKTCSRISETNHVEEPLFQDIFMKQLHAFWVPYIGSFQYFKTRTFFPGMRIPSSIYRQTIYSYIYIQRETCI